MFEREIKTLNEDLESHYLCFRDLCTVRGIPYDTKEFVMSVGSAMFAYAQMFNIHMAVYGFDDIGMVKFRFSHLTEDTHLEMNIAMNEIVRSKHNKHFRVYMFEYMKFEFDKKFVNKGE